MVINRLYIGPIILLASLLFSNPIRATSIMIDMPVSLQNQFKNEYARIPNSFMANHHELTINAQVPSTLFKNESLLKSPIVNDILLNLDPSNAIDVGFINNNRSQDAEITMAKVGIRRIANRKSYALDFNEGQLIYFDLPKSVDMSSAERPKSKVPAAQKSAAISNEGRIGLSKYIIKHIINNAINNQGVVEANHILIKDDRIVLDLKEETINNVPQNEYELTQTIKRIQEHTKPYYSEDLLHVVWKPVKSNNPKQLVR